MIARRLVPWLSAAVVLAVSCAGATGRPAATSSPTPPPQRLIYAAQDDGTVHVYAIDQGHALLRTLSVFPCCADVRGAAAAAPTHRFYVMYNRGSQGHVASLDLVTGAVLWDKVLHSPGVDRGSVTPDGKTLYLPTWESDASSPYELVVDAITGDVRSRISLPPRSHDTLVSFDGSRVYMETKSATHTMYIGSTTTDQVVATVKGYCCSGVLAPFAVNGRGTRVVNDVLGYTGFQVGDLTTGRVSESVPSSGSTGHGIAFSPDERQVWLNDGVAPVVHVFDMTQSPPHQVALVRVSNPGPHWVTFDIDGRYAYVAGPKGTGDPTDVIDTSTDQRVAELSASEDLLEVDFEGSTVVAAGNQFGIGRVIG